MATRAALTDDASNEDRLTERRSMDAGGARQTNVSEFESVARQRSMRNDQ
jgi:hypothetical protein